MKVALVYDRINKFGGAERLLLNLKKVFPQAPLYTLVHQPSTSSWAKKFNIFPSPINNLAFLRSHHEWLSPLAPMMFETFKFDQYDLVISVTSSDAKAILTKPSTLHLCYCLTPPRYLWGNFPAYQKDIKMKLLPNILKKYFRFTDLIYARRPDHYLAISQEVKKRISKYYQLPSQVIYPPVDNKFFSLPLIPIKKRKFFLVVSRLIPYKNLNLVIKTFNQLPDQKLIVIGTGSQKKPLRSLANKNIIFKGHLSDQKLTSFYSQAKAVIFPQIEDFGLVPLEAQACGTPVLAFKAGGAKETIIDQKTGLFFPAQSIKSLKKTIKHFLKTSSKFSPAICRQQAQNFSQRGFQTQLSAKVNTLWQKHQKNQSI